MFVFTLILLFILKLKFPKRKSIVNYITFDEVSQVCLRDTIAGLRIALHFPKDCISADTARRAAIANKNNCHWPAESLKEITTIGVDLLRVTILRPFSVHVNLTLILLACPYGFV